MHALAVVVAIVGALGFVMTFAGVITIAPLGLWGAVAGVGMVVTMLTRRPND